MINDDWLKDALNISEVSLMISERKGFDSSKDEIITIESMVDDVDWILWNETDVMNNMSEEHEKEEIKDCKKTISQCNKWLKKWKV